MRFAVVACLALALSTAASRAAGADDAGAEFFESRVRPVLAEKCYSCHSADAKKLKGGLYVDSREGLLKGGESGAALVPGQPERSRLVAAVGYQDPDLQMPPKGKLSAQQIADLGEWVKRGAPWPGGAAKKGTPSPAGDSFDLQQRKAAHWAWRPIRPMEPPAVRDGAWAATPLDRFILAKLEDNNLRPAPPADRRALLRRASFDLIGLPPTPAEVQTFLDDPSPRAFEAVVDRLLASPHFGERWGRHWLDLVRFAETRGHEFDAPIPNAWQYRDYVVRALNADVPYDQFVTEHLAGDLLAKPRLDPGRGFNESVLGTGFWLLGEEVHSPVDIRQDEADRMNSRLDTMTKALLGLTVGCARCHDHKFDAISARDHYALTGFLLSGAYRQVPFEGMAQNRRVAERLRDLREAARPQLFKAAAAALRPGIARAADSLRADAPLSDGRMEAAWKDQLAAARADPRHPLRVFAGAPAAKSAETDQPVSPVIQVIADYSRSDAGWWQDGFTFGLGPVRPGDLDFSGTPDAPFGLVTRGAAQRDAAWPAVRVIESEADHGKLGTFGRPGRTLRTPKVTLQSGTVWHLVRGAGGVYAAVDSHVLVDGPLHGALLQQFKPAGRAKDASPPAWRWVRQDLAEYRGQRVEFEFTPSGDGPFEVARVVESERQPPAPGGPNPLVAAALAAAPDDPAGAFAKLLAAACDRLEADGIVNAPDAADWAALADWMLRNPDLFSRPDDPARRRWAEAARQAGAEQERIAREATAESHTAPALLDGNGVDESVLVRGVARNPGERVPRRFLEALAGPDQSPYPDGTSGRLELARAMLSPDDPFPARVMVNRLWQHLFGTGLVPTVDNFGVLGEPPSHPELLDYLAAEFRGRQQWSVKQAIRAMVLSRTYQMASRADPVAEEAAKQADPRNRLLHRMPIRRLEAEAIRDAILAVSGRLDATVGGPSVEVYLTEFMDGRGRPGASGPLDGAGRRSLYTKVRRNFLPPMMLAFDAPIPFATVGRRSVSNVPAQALILMNDPFVLQQAKGWAKRVLSAGGGEDARVAGMYQAAFARPPTPGESDEARDFLKQAGALYGGPADDPRPWADLCHVLLNTKEFIFIE